MAEDVIFLVEDDTDTREFMELFLTEAGYRVQGWSSRRGAHDLAREIQPHMVIMDLQMEEPIAGWYLLEELRADAATRSIPAILYSADQQFLNARRDALREHCCAALPKPFAPEQLLATVRRLIDEPRQARAM